MLRMLIVGECLFEGRANQAITDTARESAQIQALAGGIDWAEKTKQSPLQVLRANQERLGFLFARFDQANRWLRWQGGEEVLLRPRTVEFESAVKFQHQSRIPSKTCTR